MDQANKKCVMIIDEHLPLGIISNTAAVMGVTLGKHLPQAVGANVLDRTGCEHLGIIEFPIPILKGNRDLIRELHCRLSREQDQDLLLVDFSDLAQSCKTYDEYIAKMAAVPEADLAYLGIAIYGDKKKVNKLTGSLPLLR